MPFGADVDPGAGGRVPQMKWRRAMTQNTKYKVAYECIGLDIGETVAGTLPHLGQVIERAHQLASGELSSLLVGIDILGGTREQGAQVTRATFDAVCDMVGPDTHVYVAWNEQDEPRYVRDQLLGFDRVSVGKLSLSTGSPEVSALRFDGITEFAGLDRVPQGESPETRDGGS